MDARATLCSDRVVGKTSSLRVEVVRAPLDQSRSPLSGRRLRGALPFLVAAFALWTLCHRSFIHTGALSRCSLQSFPSTSGRCLSCLLLRGATDQHSHVIATQLPPEKVRGNVEYKLKLSANKGSARFEELVTQLNWRMRECADDDEQCVDIKDLGHYREAIYRIGVADDGQVVGLDDEELALSLRTIEEMAECISAVATVVSLKSGISPGNRSAATVLIRASRVTTPGEVPQWKEVRICTVGNVDSGKSTLLGVLTKGLRDDGRGAARASVFRHQHEIESGRTSSIASLLLGFDESGRTVNYAEDSQGIFRNDDPEHRARLMDLQAMVVERSSKLITFSDLCGHERYFKTTLMGLVGLNPDYLLCTIDANRGEMRGMVDEHLVVANALAIPAAVCMTKCDMAEKEMSDSALSDVKKFLKDMGAQPFVVKDKNDVVLAAERILQGYVPIIQCSAVTGAMIPEIKLLLNLLVKRTAPPAGSVQGAGEEMMSALVTIEDVYPSVPGAGLVVAGRVVHGTVAVGDTLKFGPVVEKTSGNLVRDGFIEVRVSSMRFQNVPTTQLSAGTVGTFALKMGGKVKALLTDSKHLIERGKVLVGKRSKLLPTMYLKANVTILQHPSSIRLGYEPVLHIGMVRQSARVISMHAADSGDPVETLRAGDAAEVLFQWAHRPEIIEAGSALIFRENLVKGIGSITWVGDAEKVTTKTRSGARRTSGKDSKTRSTPVVRKKGEQQGRVKSRGSKQARGKADSKTDSKRKSK